MGRQGAGCSKAALTSELLLALLDTPASSGVEKGRAPRPRSTNGLKKKLTTRNNNNNMKLSFVDGIKYLGVHLKCKLRDDNDLNRQVRFLNCIAN